MEKFDVINLLYDFYGPLLTDKQRRFIELYYAHDLSLAEVAEQVGISRQAVYDILKRSVKALKGYEEKLGLVAKHLENQALLDKALWLFESDESEKMMKIRDILVQLRQREEA